MPNLRRTAPFLRGIRKREGFPTAGYPFDMPAVQFLDRLALGQVTFLFAD